MHTPSFAKYYLFLPILSIILLKIKLLQQHKILVFQKYKFYKLILKKKNPPKKKKTFLMLPKLIIVLLFLSEYPNELKNHKENIKSDIKSPVDYDSISNIRTNFLNQQNQLFALSKLKYRNHNTFSRCLLLLSGDIEINPGPEFSCPVCQKKIALRHRVLCCYKCNTWVHKKCTDITEHRYKSIKNNEIGIYFDCERCNFAEELPFFSRRIRGREFSV